MSDEFRSGFVCFVGRPNTGKSTLTNALVGQKVAITSNRPQTTRHTIRGIVHRENFQIVLVDTPGLHRPRTLLGKRLNELVKDTYSEVDVIGFCIPADEGIGPGDRWIFEQISAVAPRTTLIVVVTKTDKVSREKVAEQLVAVQEEFGAKAADIVPVSATAGQQIDVLTEVLVSHLEPGPAFYPDGELTDEPEEVLMAELIREAALEGVRDELPHSLAVVIDEVEDMPSSSTFRHRFGSLVRAYQLVGYSPSRDYRYIETNRTLRTLHPEVVEQVIADIAAAGGTVRRDPITDLLHINEEFHIIKFFKLFRHNLFKI